MKAISRRSSLLGGTVASLVGAWSRAPAMTPIEPIQADGHELQLLDEGALVVSIEADGRPGLGLLDTGASVTVFDSGFLEPRSTDGSSVRLQSDLGSSQADRLKSVSLTFAGSTVVLPAPVSADLANLTQTLGRSIQCVIGQDAFQSAIELDVPARKIRVLTQTPVFGSAWREVALFPGPNGRRCLRVGAEAAEDVPAVFDLGSSNPVMLSRAFASKWDLLDGRRLSTAATGTLAGIEISTTLSLRSLDVGRWTLRDVPAEVFDNWTEESVPMNVGLPVFSRFRMILDLPHDRLWLMASPETNLPFTRERSGLGVAFRGDRLNVVHVAANSPAAREGWHIGDEIISIDAVRVDLNYQRSELSKWRNGPENTLVTLQLIDGSRRVIRLVDYY